MKQKAIPWELIISKFKQRISEDDQAELNRWAADPESQAILEELEILWKKIQLKSSCYTPDKDYYWKELSKRMNTSDQKEQTERTKKKVGTSPIYRYITAACFILAMGISYFLGGIEDNTDNSELIYTCMSGKSKISLPDGSDVWLHANTTLTYNNDLKNKDRLVKMSGEAYFEVSKNEKKKFIVQTDDMQIMVHGTQFNIDASQQNKEKRVSLMEGSISLKTPSGEIFLKPGDIATYNKESNQMKVEHGNVDFDRLWIKDKLIISKEPLGNICRLLSKWYDVQINLDDNLKNKYLYTFTVQNESLEEILRLMSRINPISYYFDENNILTISIPKTK